MKRRGKRGPLLSLLLALCLTAALPGRTFAATLPAGFTEIIVATMVGSPTAMQFSPDGRLFVAQQNGIMPVWQNGTQLSANFFSNVPLVTDSGGERGLLGVTFDPNYPSNRYIYVYYTISGGDHHNRVSRFTSDASGNLALAGSEVVIWEGDAHSAGNHNGGAIHFGADGKLYIATGDNAEGSTTAQSLRSQHGKILRINANGSIPLDNPFHDSTGPNRDAIWSLGLRNPFTFAFQPGTGRMFVNDVGQNTWEEINDGGTSQSGRGLNYGWADTEGDFNQTTFPNFTRPFYAYHHSSGQPSGYVITGGAFYNPTTSQFGGDYQGDYFFADFGRGWIYRIDPATKVVTQFATGAGAVDLKVTDDGALYYLAYGSKQVFKVIKPGLAPLITLQPVDQTTGEGGQATFSVDASGGATFQWQYSADSGTTWGNMNGSIYKNLIMVNLQLSYNNYLFRAIAANASGSVTSNSAKLTVIADTAPNSPVISVTGGLTDSKFVAGQTITFSGTATDPEEGALGASAFAWTINYLTSIDQGDSDNDGMPGLTRPFSTVSNVTSGSFTPSTTGPYTLADVAYAITLVVTDNLGLTATSRQIINPKTSTITLESVPTGLNLTRDTQPVTTPNAFLGVVGFQRPIGAPLSQAQSGTNYNFSSWSDSGSANHTIATPSVDTIYAATYSVSSLPVPWWHADIGIVGTAGSASHSAGSFTVNGSGSLRNNADAFHYVYQEATGDCGITARVTSLPYDKKTNKSSQGGVMIRSDLSPGSPFVFMGLQGKSSLQMSVRTAAGGKSKLTKAGSGFAPYWMRVTRTGNTFTTYRSANGLTWTKVRSQDVIGLGSTVYIGLAVCSEASGLQALTFDNVDAAP